MSSRKYFSIMLCISLLLFSCNSDYVIKRRGYFKIPFPKKEYKLFDVKGYPYTFEYPVYANVVKDSTFFEDQPENDWWININFPQFDGKVYISYKQIGKYKFDSLLRDVFYLSYKGHTHKATAIEPSTILTPNKIHGIYFTLKGNTATANQFFLTDSTKHFLRGALYFNVTPNEDSLAEVNNFLKKDLWHIINTMKWR